VLYYIIYWDALPDNKEVEMGVTIRNEYRHFRVCRRLVVGLLLSIMITSLTIQNASAVPATRYVATTGSNAGNNCTDIENPCLTITRAISQAVGGDEIQIARGTYIENLFIIKDLTLRGAGMGKTILDGDNSDRVIYIDNGDYVINIYDLTVRNGSTDHTGGGIADFSNDTLTLRRVMLTNNSSDGGGGLFTSSPLIMTDCIVSNNQADVDSNSVGGGVMIDTSGAASINRATIDNNTAARYSGGIHMQGDGTLRLTNVTISNNTADFGGGMFNTGSGETIVLNSTFADNNMTGGGSGSGVMNFSTVSFKNTIISGSDNDLCDNRAFWTSLGHNLESGDTCLFTEIGDHQNTDPVLGPLALNGGITQTHALLEGSPAIDAGVNTGCPAFDQRSISRPRDGNDNGVATCDIGAYEYIASEETVFISEAADDGHILESGENTSRGGTINARDSQFLIGDNSSDRQYRAIVSFDTSTMADNARITSVVIKIKKYGQAGTDPFTTHQALKVDVRKPYFGDEVSLVVEDFQAQAGMGAVGEFVDIPLSDWYKATLKDTVCAYINLTDTTQFRLRFQLGDNDDEAADYLAFYSGNTKFLVDRPVLIVTYFLP
jgi:hypothetical protein